MKTIDAKNRLLSELKDINVNVSLDNEDMFLFSIDGKNGNSIGGKIDKNISIWGYEEDIILPLDEKSIVDCIFTVKKCISNGFTIQLLDNNGDDIYSLKFLSDDKLTNTQAKKYIDEFASLVNCDEYNTAKVSDFYGTKVYTQKSPSIERLQKKKETSLS